MSSAGSYSEKDLSMLNDTSSGTAALKEFLVGFLCHSPVSSVGLFCLQKYNL